MRRKLLALGLSLVILFALTTVGFATDIDIIGSAASGYVDIDAREYVGGTLGSHHSFDAWGSFNYDVNFSSAGSGMLDMNIPSAESSSYAGFQAVWRQDFTVTATYGNHAGVFGLYAEGTGGATMNVERGNKPWGYHIKCPSNYGGYEPISAEGTTPIGEVVGNPSYVLESWLEAYENYSDIGNNPPTDWSTIRVMGSGGTATIDFSGPYASYAKDGGVEHDQFSTVNVDTGSGTYFRSVGGENYLAWEGFTAPSGGSATFTGSFSGGLTANPWTDAN